MRNIGRRDRSRSEQKRRKLPPSKSVSPPPQPPVRPEPPHRHHLCSELFCFPDSIVFFIVKRQHRTIFKNNTLIDLYLSVSSSSFDLISKLVACGSRSLLRDCASRFQLLSFMVNATKGVFISCDIPMAQYIINMNASLPASDKFIIHILDSTHMFVQPHVELMIRSQISKFREDNTYVKPS
ncbi:general transcription and DNA repair factor IIH subunit TFB5 [Trifolium repens]|nr:general transcription and DNA repair factor IIH subunit TFB5 [Trifolium repens]